VIQLGGGTLTATAAGASLTDAAGSTLEGFGTVTATTFANSGTIEASGGTLTLTDAVSGTGDLEIAAGATLVLAATAATTNAATFDGTAATLTLDHTGDLSGAIGGIGLDDIFDLVGVTANGASVNGSNQLVVTDNGTTVNTLQLSGSNSGFAFATQAVSGGTDVISLPIPATVADYEAYTSLYNQISGGFSISDTAANISAGLNSLNGSNINSISISDNNPVGVDVAQLSSDATAISKLANANGSPYQLAVTDSLPNIVGDLSALNGNSHVSSLDATSGAATMSSGATVAAPAFTLTGSTTALTLSEILSYSGTFSAEAGATVSISKGDSLTLTGAGRVLERDHGRRGNARRERDDDGHGAHDRRHADLQRRRDADRERRPGDLRYARRFVRRRRQAHGRLDRDLEHPGQQRDRPRLVEVVGDH
jgi:hypothetical protein